MERSCWRPGWVNMLCSWAKCFPPTLPLSTQEYKLVLENFQGRPAEILGGKLASHPEGCSDTPSHLMLRKLG